MGFGRDRREGSDRSQRIPARGVVDALVVNDQDLWVIVARHGEPIEEWLHGWVGEEIAPLRVCRKLPGPDRVVLDKADPHQDHLLSETEERY